MIEIFSFLTKFKRDLSVALKFNGVSSGSGSSVSELCLSTRLTPKQIKPSLNDLQESGFLTIDGEGYYYITKLGKDKLARFSPFFNSKLVPLTAEPEAARLAENPFGQHSTIGRNLAVLKQFIP